MKLSSGLEELSLYSAIQGHTDLKKIRKEELSRPGQFLYDGLVRLAMKHKPPFSPKSVYVAATDVAGGDPDVIRPYLYEVLDSGGNGDATDLAEAVRDKMLLMEVVNIASTQMSKGVFDAKEFISKFKNKMGSVLQAVASYFTGNVRHKMPEGVPLPHLPRIQAATHGVYGYWALSGDSGVGKSTLALEIAVMVGKERPVLYYDYENGIPVLLAHLSEAFQFDNAKIREATKQLHFRTSIYTLDADLAVIGKPCFIVVDSIQKIAVRGDDRRAGIEKWVHRLEELKHDGHCILIVSEKNRAYYGKTGQAGYKETGEIEYAVDLGMELVEVKDAAGIVEVELNKNRNWPMKGYIVTLSRVNSWWFAEVGGKGGEENKSNARKFRKHTGKV